MATVHIFAEVATPEPLLEPPGLRSREKGLRHRLPFPAFQPRPLQPLNPGLTPRQPANSVILVLPNRTAPASRSFCATKESRKAIEPSRTRDPAVVVILSAVATLSLSKIGMPCNCPRGPFDLRSASSCSAIERASGLVSRTARRAGPFLLIDSIRSRYIWVIDRDVYCPDCIFS